MYAKISITYLDYVGIRDIFTLINGQSIPFTTAQSMDIYLGTDEQVLDIL